METHSCESLVRLNGPKVIGLVEEGEVLPAKPG